MKGLFEVLSFTATNSTGVGSINCSAVSPAFIAIMTPSIAISPIVPAAVLAKMITRVTEGGYTFGGCRICVTGLHQPANSNDIMYISAWTTVEIAVER